MKKSLGPVGRGFFRTRPPARSEAASKRFAKQNLERGGLCLTRWLRWRVPGRPPGETGATVACAVVGIFYGRSRIGLSQR